MRGKCNIFSRGCFQFVNLGHMRGVAAGESGCI